MLDGRRLLNAGVAAAAGLRRRGVESDEIEAVVMRASRVVALRRELEKLRARANRNDRGALGPSDLARELKAERQSLELDFRMAESAFLEAAELLPNLPDDSAPSGLLDADNRIVDEYAGTLRVSGSDAQRREFIPTSPLTASASIAGSGFAVLRGESARLQRGLATLALELHGAVFEEVSLPALVSEQAMRASGHLPKFASGAYAVANSALWLTPTAEVAFCALHRGEVIDRSRLPIRYIAQTPCFRREIGSGGTAARHRLHQYHQVELFSLCEPKRGLDELAFLLASAQEALRRLGLRYRVVELCCGQLPFSAAKAYKLEIFLPVSGYWLDVSTVSFAGDFLARRGDIRFADAGQRELVHTINASALACSRILDALVEYGINASFEALESVLSSLSLNPKF
jgi:seryl-tRNA synthetase